MFPEAAASYERGFRSLPDTRTVAALAASSAVPFDPRSEEFWVALRSTMGSRLRALPDRCGFCDATAPEDELRVGGRHEPALFQVGDQAVCRDCTAKARDLLGTVAARTIIA